MTLTRSLSRGQTLVEFALVFPVFWTFVLGVIEFAFAFSAVLDVNFAARNAALLAAEAGNAPGADCVILQGIERDLTGPTAANQVVEVEIYRYANGGQAETTTYQRSGTRTCTFGDGSSVTVPYTSTGDGYPESGRCNILAGCGGGRSLDTVGVRITYVRTWVTPLHLFIGGDPVGFRFDRSSTMRMEPVL